nr:MAG TPA: hypothetical protein [Caudoviricetes sp.]
MLFCTFLASSFLCQKKHFHVAGRLSAAPGGAGHGAGAEALFPGIHHPAGHPYLALGGVRVGIRHKHRGGHDRPGRDVFHPGHRGDGGGLGIVAAGRCPAVHRKRRLEQPHRQAGAHLAEQGGIFVQSGACRHRHPVLGQHRRQAGLSRLQTVQFGLYAHLLTALNVGQRFFNVPGQAHGAAAGIPRRHCIAGTGKAVDAAGDGAVVLHASGKLGTVHIGGLSAENVRRRGGGVGGGDVLGRDGRHRHLGQHLTGGGAHRLGRLGGGHALGFGHNAHPAGAVVVAFGDGHGSGAGIQHLAHAAVVGHGAGHFGAACIGGLPQQNLRRRSGGAGGVHVGGGDSVHRHLAQHLARRGGDGLGGLGGGDGFFLGDDLHGTAAAVVTLGHRIAGTGRVQCFGHGAVVGHAARHHRPVRRHDDLACEHVRLPCGHRGHILVLGGDGPHRHVGQAVVALVRSDLLGFLGGGGLLALQVVIAAARHTGHRAGAVVVTFGDGVGLALLHLGRDPALVGDPAVVLGQLVQLFGAGGDFQLHRLGPQGVPGRLDAGNFCLNTQKRSSSDGSQKHFNIAYRGGHGGGSDGKGVVLFHLVGGIHRQGVGALVQLQAVADPVRRAAGIVLHLQFCRQNRSLPQLTADVLGVSDLPRQLITGHGSRPPTPGTPPPPGWPPGFCLCRTPAGRTCILPGSCPGSYHGGSSRYRPLLPG